MNSKDILQFIFMFGIFLTGGIKKTGNGIWCGALNKTPEECEKK